MRAAYIIFVSLLAIGTIPTFSIKPINISQKHLPFIVVGAVFLIVALLGFATPFGGEQGGDQHASHRTRNDG